MQTLKNSREFSPVYNKGVKIYTKYTIIFILKNNFNKFGFVTSKKSGNAVMRNRLRRLFRSVVREESDKFSKNCSYIIVAKSNCKDDFKILNHHVIKKDILLGIKKYEKNISRNNKNISKNIK